MKVVGSQKSLVGRQGNKWLVFFLLITVYCLLTTLIYAQNPQQKFETANQAYFSRNFPEAIKNYEELEKSGLHSADLYYNLANAHYRQGEIGEAIYNYLKALRLAPRDRDLVANFNYILSKRAEGHELRLRERAKNAIFFLKDLLTLKEMMALALISYWLLFAFAVLFYMKRKKGFLIVLLVFAVFNLYILPTAFQKYYEEKIRRIAVVVTPTLSVFSEPSIDSIKLFELREGAMAEVKGEQSGFLKIRYHDGKTGWARAEQLKTLP